MLDRLSLLAPGLDGAQRRPTSASRSSSCSPTSATSCPTARTPSRPRPTSRPRGGARRCAATPGSSTTACTRAATRAPGSACCVDCRACASRSAARPPLLTRVSRGSQRVVEPGGARAPRGAGRPAPRRSRPSSPRCCYADLDELDFWTWGDAGCCLPRGATSATLAGDHPALQARATCSCSPRSSARRRHAAGRRPGQARRRPADARQGVHGSRGRRVRRRRRPDDAVAVTEIAWDEADALAFALCVSVPEQPDLVVERAWGNIVLADHGRTIAGEDLGAVPEPVLDYAPATAADRATARRRCPSPFRFRPTLAAAPLTHARPGADARARRGAHYRRRRRGSRRAFLRRRRCTTGSRRAACASSTAPPSCAAATTAGRSSDGATVALLRRSGGDAAADRAAGERCGDDARRRRAARSRGRRHRHVAGGQRAVARTGRPACQRRRRRRVRRRARTRRHRDAAIRRRRPRPPARIRARRSRRPTGSATAAAGNVGAGAIAHVVTTRPARSSASTTRCPAIRRDGRRSPRRPSAATRPRPSSSSSAPSPPTTTRA